MREKRRFTQRQLSIKCELDVTIISHFENVNSKRKPCFFNIIKIAKALNVTADYLLGLSPEYTPSNYDDALYWKILRLSESERKSVEYFIHDLVG
jgi:transcriptional regulator with XRE-family HTH domain